MMLMPQRPPVADIRSPSRFTTSFTNFTDALWRSGNRQASANCGFPGPRIQGCCGSALGKGDSAAWRTTWPLIASEFQMRG
jgi:hypothetical protein